MAKGLKTGGRQKLGRSRLTANVAPDTIATINAFAIAHGLDRGQAIDKAFQLIQFFDDFEKI